MNNEFKSLEDSLKYYTKYYSDNTEFRFNISSKSSTISPDIYSELYYNLRGDNIYFHFYLNMREKRLEIARFLGEYKRTYQASNHPAIVLGNYEYFIFDIDRNFQPAWRDKKGNLLLTKKKCRKLFYYFD